MSKEPNNTRGDGVVDQLAKDSRAQEARMLPVSGSLTPDQLDFVRKRISERCDDKSLSYEQIDKKVGCARKAVRRFMDGNYEHSDSTFARKLDRWLKGTEPGHGGMPTEYVSTIVAEKMIGLIKQVFLRKSMGVIVGPSGTSKSTVLKAVQTGFISNSVHIELNSTDSKLTPLLRRISIDLGLHERYNSQRLMFNINRALKGTDRLLMIDEAHYLDKRSVNALRDIHKATRCPIMLVGTQDLLETIDDFNEFHGQMKSLISMTYNITREIQQKGTPLYSVDEIIAYAKAMNLRLDISGADFVANLASTMGWGGLRSAAYLMLNASHLARGKVITAKMLNSALREMSGYDGFQQTKFKSESNRKVGAA